MEQILNNEWGIYKIDFPNGKSYVGQSSNLKRRINDYKN
jgi:predicted GIY-YIG superfamily endonuclease